MFESIGFVVSILIGLALCISGCLVVWFVKALSGKYDGQSFFGLILLCCGIGLLYYTYINSPFEVVKKGNVKPLAHTVIMLKVNKFV